MSVPLEAYWWAELWADLGAPPTCHETVRRTYCTDLIIFSSLVKII